MSVQRYFRSSLIGQDRGEDREAARDHRSALA